MSKTNKILLGVLAAQILLMLATWTWVNRESAPPAADKPLLQVKASDITRITVTGTQGDTTNPPVTLSLDNGKWVLESAQGYPALKDKVDELIKTLADIHVGEPIARGVANRNALNVGDKSFDRKVEISAGKETQTLFIGRGGRSSSNVRIAGSNDVLSAKGLSSWTIGAAPSNFVDTLLLEADPASVDRIVVTNAKGVIDFAKQEGKWVLPVIPEGKVVDEQKVSDLVSKLSRVTMTLPVGKTDKPEYGMASGTRVEISGVKEGTAFKKAYTIGAKLENTFYVKSDDSPFIVAVSTYGVDQAVEKTAADFVKDPPAPGTDTGAIEDEMPQGMPEGMMGELPPGMIMPEM